jgi:integrase
VARKINTEINGSKYFRVTATIGRNSEGKLIRKQFYGISQKDAENKRDEYLNNIKNGLNIKYDNSYLGEIMHLWLFEVIKMKVKPTSFERYEGIFRNYIKSSDLYGIKMNKLTTLQIQRFYNNLYEKDKKTSASIKYLNKLLKSFLSYAVEEGYILRNPCNSKIIIPGAKDRVEAEIEIFTPEEIKTLRQSLKGHDLECLILLALGTGLRQGELLALTWDDIDLKNNEIDVTKTIKRTKIFDNDGNLKGHEIIIQPPKSKSSIRVVPIPSNLIKILKSHELKQKKNKIKFGDIYSKDNLVFATETGNSLSTKNIFMSYKNLLIKAKISHKKFHALRHTYATQLFEKGEPLKTVQTLLGHGDISITSNIYTHVMPKQKSNAAEKLNDLFI